MREGFLGLTLFCLPIMVFAQQFQQGPIDLGRIGSHNTYTFYFSIVQPLSTNCNWGNVYCPSTNPECKSLLSIALAAKTSAKRVAITYNQDGQGLCSLHSMEMP